MYAFENKIPEDRLNNHRFHELKFMPVYEYEKELKISLNEKISMLDKIIRYMEGKGIEITFTDRILDDIKQWEREDGQDWRYMPIAELQGNNICINPRNIDFLSVLMSIGHIYGHLVQRMEYEKYKPLTDLLETPKPLDLEKLFADYTKTYGGNYKEDFLEFEKEAFSYAKFTFIDAGIVWSENIEYAMNVYIESDFNELWKWIVESPNKNGTKFMDEFQKLWESRKGYYPIIPEKEINIKVIPDKNGSLVVVRNDDVYLSI